METPDGLFMRCWIIVHLRKGTVGNVVCISYTCICHLLLILLMNVVQLKGGISDLDTVISRHRMCGRGLARSLRSRVRIPLGAWSYNHVFHGLQGTIAVERFLPAVKGCVVS